MWTDERLLAMDFAPLASVEDSGGIGPGELWKVARQTWLNYSSLPVESKVPVTQLTLSQDMGSEDGKLNVRIVCEEPSRSIVSQRENFANRAG